MKATIRKMRLQSDYKLSIDELSKKELNTLRKNSLTAFRENLITEDDMRFAYLGDKKIPNVDARIAAYINWALVVACDKLIAQDIEDAKNGKISYKGSFAKYLPKKKTKKTPT